MMENPYSFHSQALDKSGLLLEVNSAKGTPQDEAMLILDEHFTVEESIISIGALHLAGAVLLMILTFIFFKDGEAYRLTLQVAGVTQAPSNLWRHALCVLMMVGSLANVYVGMQLLKLNGRYRLFSTVLCIVWCIALFWINWLVAWIVCVLNAYMIYLLQSKKGRFVCSVQYREIASSTSYRPPTKTPPYAWYALALVIGGLVLFVITLANS